MILCDVKLTYNERKPVKTERRRIWWMKYSWWHSFLLTYALAFVRCAFLPPPALGKT